MRSPDGQTGSAPVPVSGDIVLDPAHQTVTRAGRDISLTRNELAVLEELLRSEDAVVSTEELLERVWDERADRISNAVRVAVTNLRKKLGDPAVIETVIGVGYRV